MSFKVLGHFTIFIDFFSRKNCFFKCHEPTVQWKLKTTSSYIGVSMLLQNEDYSN
jgi:hypothetical protein